MPFRNLEATKVDPNPEVDPVNFYVLAISDEKTSHFDAAVAAFNKCATVPGGLQPTCKSGAEEAKETGRHAVERTAIRGAGAWRALLKDMTQSDAGQLEERLGYRFKKPELLERALTHSSAVPELRAERAEESAEAAAIQDNETARVPGRCRSGIVGEGISAGVLSRLERGPALQKPRAACERALSARCRASRVKLGEHLRLGRGEEKTGGREKPALLADAFEAVVAAVYMDAGLGATREMLKRLLFEQALDERGERISRLGPQVRAPGIPARPRQAARRIPAVGRKRAGSSEIISGGSLD